MVNSDKKSRRPNTESRFYNRRRKLLAAIKADAALFCSAAPQKKSRDSDHPYAYSTDLFYLTGHTEENSALLLLGSQKGPRSILFLRDRDPVTEQWTGERLGLKRAKKIFKVDEVRPIESLRTDLPQLLLEFRSLYYSAGIDPVLDTAIWELFRSPVGPRHNFPSTLRDARLLTSELRFIKDRDEIRAIKHAADITAHSLNFLATQLGEAASELHAAGILEAEFARLGGAGVAFETIVASGRNSTCLHHRPTRQPLWKQELVLVDCGAAFSGYCADITRTFPVSGKFTPPQADIYDAVFAALKSCTASAKPGATLAEIHNRGVESITESLVRLKLLRGSVEQLIAQGRYKRFFMHRIGHWLGLDVHDISPLDGGKNLAGGHPSHHRPLVPGNIFTVEPGIYIDSRDESVPKHYRGIGVRLEDDVLITESAREVLTAKVPVERSEIEALVKGE